jgi:molybdenum cofactor guanylyltransferase
MDETPATIGLLLAGGRSIRMGGGDKSLRRLGKTTILDHIINRMRRQCSELILNANGATDRFSVYNLPVVEDCLPDHPGPLAGILSGLEWTKDNRPDIDWLLSISTDTPFLPQNLVSRLHGEIERTGAQLACASSGGWAHPVVGLWPVALACDLRLALTGEGLRKIDKWTARYHIIQIEWPIEPVDPFFNVNTPEDLILAEDLYAVQAEVEAKQKAF